MPSLKRRESMCGVTVQLQPLPDGGDQYIHRYSNADLRLHCVFRRSEPRPYGLIGASGYRRSDVVRTQDANQLG